MAESTGEKNQEATPERLRKARQEGNVPKSHDLTTALQFLSLLVLLVGTIRSLGHRLREFTAHTLTTAVSAPSGTAPVIAVLREALAVAFQICLPVLAVALGVGVLVNYLQVGSLFTTKPIKPDLKRVDPAQGLKGFFKMKKLVEFLKNLVKFSLIATLLYSLLAGHLADVVHTVGLPLPDSLALAGEILRAMGQWVAVAFLLIAIADYFYQRRSHAKEMRMSTYEVRQEYKQMEGDPQVKGQRRQLAEELLFQGSLEDVKSADVIIVNPDHIAVAIRYDRDANAAPEVVAKGIDLYAEKIKEVARQYGIPVMRNVPLAQALNRLQVGDEIPEELYEAVAEVLNFVYTLDPTF